MAEAQKPPRIPLSHTIATRDSTMQKDAICWNAHPTKGSDGRSYAERRFGVQLSSHIGTGIANGLFAFGSNILEVIGTTFYANGVSKGTVDGTTRYQFTLTGQGGTGVFLKNNSAAYTWNGTVLTQVMNASTQGVNSITLTTFGSGYTASFPITFIPNPSTSAVATSTLTGAAVTAVNVTTAGAGYISAPTVSFTGGGGTGATATANISGGQVTSVTVTAGGSGYTSAPTVVFTGGGPGTGATATANVVSGQVTSTTVTNPGSGYIAPPTVSFAAGSGTGAAGTAVVLAGWLPVTTVPGVANLDSYIFVLDTAGRIWNSNLNTPLIGNPLNFISGSLQAEPGVYITRLYNYIASMCQFSTTFYYDAGNTPPGSPLLPNYSSVVNVGCACDNSVVTTENTMFWIGQTRQKGRSVYTMNALTPQKISDQYIDKILNADPLVSSTVYSYFIKINGHAFYVLTLIASNCTLVFDVSAGAWHRWSSTALGTSRVASNAYLDQTTGFVNVVLPGHGFTNGTVLQLTSTNTSATYLGTVVPRIIDNNTFSYIPGVSAGFGGINSTTINTYTINAEPNRPVGSTTGPALGTLTVTPYLQNYFNQVMYANANNTDYLLGLNDGNLYAMTENVGDDNGMFIYALMRTQADDFGSNAQKFYGAAEVIADKISDVAYLGYSDDDFISFGLFRQVNLMADRSKLERCSSARRRAWALLYIGGLACRFNELELSITPGSQ